MEVKGLFKLFGLHLFIDYKQQSIEEERLTVLEVMLKVVVR